MIPFQRIAERIAAATGEPCRAHDTVAVGGGCINNGYRLSDGDRHWFVKTNRAAFAPMFEAELAGLEALRAADALRVPQPLVCGSVADYAFLAMEFIAPGQAGPRGQWQAGERLARLHRQRAARFGFSGDNWIGSTHQINTEADDWISFFRDHRLRFQIDLAINSGAGVTLQRLGERLCDALPALLDHTPQPSLLHGDLWGGNLGFDAIGEPFVFDPAVYFGDRETDLAMTRLFGGFSADFYAGYESGWPLDPGHRERVDLYNLYHVLNHFNLFGGGYLAQAESMLRRLLATVGDS